MIPYFSFEKISLGPLTIQVWGLFVSLGILLAVILSYFLAKKKGLNYQSFLDLAFWAILSALVFARVFHLFYELKYFLENPLDILKIWQGGMSIFGGFFGAILAGVIFLKIKKLNFWQYAEIIFFFLPLGLFVGRIGCFMIHDHLGKIASWPIPWGIEYMGQVRHENGLYDSISGLVLFLVFLLINKLWAKKLFTGFYGAMFFAWYGLVRFFLDFFRAEDLPGVSDARYLSLTVGQYLAILMFGAGVALFFILRRKKANT